MDNEKQFEGWAIVEIMGHHQMAGYLSSVTIAGSEMLRVDVPEIKGQPGFTKFFGPSAIYAITPTDESTARYAALQFQARPVDPWVLPTPLLAIPQGVDLAEGSDYSDTPFFKGDSF